MRTLPIVLSFVCGATCTAQRTVTVADAICDPAGMTKVVPLHSDSACSSFLICVPSGVPPHFHAHHTEHVSVLAGEGTMRLGDSTFTVAAGTSIVIPKGTVHAVVTTSSDPLRVISVQAPYFDGTDRVFVDP